MVIPKETIAPRAAKPILARLCMQDTQQCTPKHEVLGLTKQEHIHGLFSQVPEADFFAALTPAIA